MVTTVHPPYMRLAKVPLQKSRKVSYTFPNAVSYVYILMEVLTRPLFVKQGELLQPREVLALI